MPDPTRPKALIIGSLGTLADTADIAAAAFDTVFAEAGLDWTWTDDSRQALLFEPGGQTGLAACDAFGGAEVDRRLLAERQARAYRRALAEADLMPRPGVVELIAAARARGVAVALASTAPREEVDLVLARLRPMILREDLDFVGDMGAAAEAKPAPDIYRAALAAFDLDGSEAVAVEDTPTGAAAASAAGVTVFGYPGRAAAPMDFAGAMAVLDRLEPDRLLGLDPAADAPPVMER